MLTIYYRSLLTEYSGLVDASNPCYAENKASDYYRICLKGLLLQLIQLTLHFGLQEEHLRFLTEYTSLFKNTLTYAQELKKYWPALIANKIIVAPEAVENDNHLIH